MTPEMMTVADLVKRIRATRQWCEDDRAEWVEKQRLSSLAGDDAFTSLKANRAEHDALVAELARRAEAYGLVKAGNDA